jgi:hypothetical protein
MGRGSGDLACKLHLLGGLLNGPVLHDVGSSKGSVTKRRAVTHPLAFNPK